MSLGLKNSILNQKGTPAFYSDTFANRPTYGFAGRVFISTDTGAIYEDTGTAWTLIADAGAGTTGTLQQVTTNGNTTNQGISITAGGLSANTVSVIGGTSSQFLKANGTLDSTVYIGLTALSATTPLSYNNTTGAFSITQSGAFANGYLSSTDWNTFNNKQSTLSLTTTGSSGAATLVGTTLNVPNYGTALSGYLPLTGGTLTGALSGTSATFSGQGQFNAASNGIYLLLNAPTNGGTITIQAGGVSFADIGSELGNFGTGSATNLCVSARSGKDLILGGGALKTLTLASTGAATFSSSVTANQMFSTTTAAGYAAILTNTNGASDSNGLLVKAGSISSEYNVRFANQADTTTFFTVKGNGNVGIGTTSPNANGFSTALTINGTSTAALELSVGGTNQSYISSSSSAMVLDARTSIPMLFYTADTERMRILSGGNILLNGATSSNGQGVLQNTGQSFLSGLGFGGLTFTTNTTASVQYSFYFFNGGAGVTLSLPDTNGQSMIYFIKNNTANTLIVSRSGANTIILANTSSTVTAFNLLAGSQTLLLGQGTTSYVQIL